MQRIITQTLFVLLAFVGSASFLFAQKATVKGKILDVKSKQGLIQATLRVGAEGAQTDADGSYTLELKAGTYTLDYSYIGYEPFAKRVTLKAGETLTLDVTLSETPSLLNTVTVTSGKFDKPLSEVTVSLEVVKPTLIENSASPSLDRVVEKVPGVNIIDGQANIRGGSGYSYGAGSRVLLLVNDMPALQGDAGYPNWNDVPVENIEQIEVVKGAASALYGSSALNGIINVRTAFAKAEPITKVSFYNTTYFKPSYEKAAWWGDGGTAPYERGMNVAHRQRFGKFDLALGGAYTDKIGWRQGEYNRAGRISFYTRYRATERLSFGVNGNFNKGMSTSFFLWNGDSAKMNQPLTLPGSAPVITKSDVFRFSVDPYVTYNDASGNTHKLLSRWFHVINNNDNGQGNSSDFLYGEYQFQRKWKAIDLTTVAGVVGSSTSTNSALYGNANISSSNLAAYVQLEKKFFNRLNISVGARYESNTIANDSIKASIGSDPINIPKSSETEAKPVFRVGANYQAAKYTFIRASYGQGYRYPTIAERYIATQISILGIYPNPKLQSETGTSAELGIKQGFKVSNWQGFIDGSVFWTQYKNMMEFTFGGDATNPVGGFQSINVGDTDIKGFDVTLTGQGSLFGKKTTLLTGYTYIDPRFQNFDARQKSLSSSSDNVLKYRFRHTVKFDAETQLTKHFAVGASYMYNSRMEAVDYVFVDKGVADANHPNPSGLGNILAPGLTGFMERHKNGSNIVDVRVAYYPNDKVRIALLCKNLFNEEYSLRPALVEAPRNLTLRLDWTF